LIKLLSIELLLPGVNPWGLKKSN